MATQIGRIASLTQRVQTEVSPLQRQVNWAALLIAAVAVVAGALFLAAGTLLAGLPVGAALIYAPPLQAVFGTAAPGLREIDILATFLLAVWGWGELVRWSIRRRESTSSTTERAAL